jgi:hypothetical protein
LPLRLTVGASISGRPQPFGKRYSPDDINAAHGPWRTRAKGSGHVARAAHGRTTSGGVVVFLIEFCRGQVSKNLTHAACQNRPRGARHWKH